MTLCYTGSFTFSTSRLRKTFITLVKQTTSFKTFKIAFYLRNFKGIYLSKAFTCMKFFLYKQKCIFHQGDGYFWPHCCITMYTYHIDHFTPQHTTFEQSAACLSVFFELLPSLIPFAKLWRAW